MDALTEIAAHVALDREKERIRSKSRKAHPVVTQCSRCGTNKGRMERHHPDIHKEPDHIVVVCSKCHKAVHQGTRVKRERLPPIQVDENKYLKAEEAAAYLRFPSYQSFRSFRSRHGWPLGIKMGRNLIFTKAMLDEAATHMAERRPGPARIRVR